jgi:hypothetical protein
MNILISLISNGVKIGHNSSAEDIQDVVNSEDINIYRELAGGVTLHIYMVLQIGGQSASKVVNGDKMR